MTTTAARTKGSKTLDTNQPSALLFVGQGAQTVGMTKELLDLPEVARMYDVAQKILGYDLKQIVLEGPENLLNQTLHAQPALLIAGLAAVEKLKRDNPSALNNVTQCAGLSLGEYTALVYAGAMSFEDAMRVVQARAMAMTAAATKTDGKMVTVIGMEDQPLEEVCRRAADSTSEPVQVSNYLFPKGRVIAGTPTAVNAVVNMIQAKSEITIKELAVSGAFHTELMSSARDALIDSLSCATITTPTVPVIANISAEPYKDAADVEAGLANQLVAPVMWQNVIEHMVETGIKVFYDMGPRSQLKTMNRHINRVAFKSTLSIEC